MFETFDGLPGVITYVDDILVFGKTLKEHHDNLVRVLEKIKAVGLTLNIKKSEFLGHLISNQGIAPDMKKIEAIINMKSPESKMDLQRFLGMVEYLAKYSQKKPQF